MNTKRFFIYTALLICVTALWSSWEQEHHHASIRHVAKQNLPHRELPQSEDSKQTLLNMPKKRLISVKTDLLSIKIDKLAGKIVEADLLTYPESLEQPNTPVRLLNYHPKTFYVIENGVLSAGQSKNAEPILFQASKTQYFMGPHQKDLKITLRGKTKDGITVLKTFRLKRGRYIVETTLQLHNPTRKPWTGQYYALIKQKKPIKPKGRMLTFNTYQGISLYTPDKPYKKLSYRSLKKSDYQRSVKGGWMSIQQHYFLSAWIPDATREHHYYAQAAENEIYTIGLMDPKIQLAPKAEYHNKATLYLGPEDIKRLRPLALALDHTVDYGWLWFIALGVLWLMQHINHIVGNWGWSIILVTLAIKLLFFKLSESSYRSMAKMKNLQPRLQALQERYGNDKQALSRATMELYRSQKVNPLGGCLPFIVQIPIFISLYYVLIESVELRQAPFIAWIQDLSIKDPYYILPILMGISMWAQQRLTPTPSDPIQAKMMWVLPVVFTVLFASFPAGLVLYWLANNCFSALQQWYIQNKMLDHKKTKKKAKK